MKTILKLTVAALAAMSLNACCECDKPKFNVKEYAERKTEKLDKIVDLTDVQEKQVYDIYKAQGKEIKKHLKNTKNECCDVKHPDGKPCDKPACDKKECCDKKAECNKPCDKKAECCKKECNKPACDKKECCDKKAECCKKECNKPCDKPACDKKECCDKKAECKDGKGKHPRHHNFMNPERRKADMLKIRSILTEEQNAKLKEHFEHRRHRHPASKKCIAVPTPQQVEAANQK